RNRRYSAFHRINGRIVPELRLDLRYLHLMLQRFQYIFQYQTSQYFYLDPLIYLSHEAMGHQIRLYTSGLNLRSYATMALLLQSTKLLTYGMHSVMIFP